MNRNINEKIKQLLLSGGSSPFKYYIKNTSPILIFKKQIEPTYFQKWYAKNKKNKTIKDKQFLSH